MSKKSRFFRDGAMLTAVSLCSRSVSIVFSSLLAGWVGSEGVGLFTLIMTVYAFGITFATSGIGLTVTRLVAANYERRCGILSASLLYSSAFGSAATLILFIFAPFIANHLMHTSEGARLLMILAPTLILAAISATFNGYFVGVKRVRANAIAQTFGQALKIVVSCTLVAIWGRGGKTSSLELICVSFLITEFFSFILILILYFIDTKNHPNKEKNKAKLGEISAVALPLAFSQYVRSLLLSFEHILIPRRLVFGGLSESEALSGYGVLHGMALPTLLFPMSPLSSYSGLLVPEFAEDESRGDKERMSRLTSYAINMTLIYATAVAAFIFFFSEDLGYALYNSFDAGRYLRILALVVPIMYLDHVTDQILKGIGEQVYSMWVNIADSCLSLVLVFFLLPRLGVMGYALVIIIMEAFNFLMSLSRLLTRVKVRVKPLSAMLFPLIFSSLACHISGKLFAFGGASSRTPWLICKIIVAICIFVFFDRLVKSFLCNLNKSKKRQKNP